MKKPLWREESGDALLDCLREKKRYCRVRELDHGGLAQVACYFDTFLNRVLAVKELKDASLKNPDLVKLFLAEAKLISYLDHPGVVAVFDTFLIDNKRPCYTMKLLEGSTLTALLDRSCRAAGGPSRTSLSHYLEIFVKACQTLAYVHDKGVIHLDLKPDNIMIGRYGEVLIMDWGNARLYDSKPYQEYFRKFGQIPGLASLGQEPGDIILGTPKYMSPEQIDKPRETLLPASDIFSMGVILYEMLTGTDAFPSNDIKTLLRQVRKQTPAPVHEINPDVPRLLSQICMRMLEKTPDARYRSFHEVLDDINDYYDSGLAFSTRAYEPGATILEEGAAGDHSYLIVSGKVEISKLAKGKRKVLAELGPDEIFGELAVFTKLPRTATARAIEPTTVRVMTREEIERELDKLAPWVGQMIAGLSRRFIRLNQRVLELEQ